MPDDHADPAPRSRVVSRRAAVLRLAGIAAAPFAVAACSKREDGEAADAKRTTKVEPAAPDARSEDATRPSLPDLEPVVRVRIERVRGGRGTVRIGAEGQWIRAAVIDDPHGAVVVKGPLEARRGDRGWVLAEAGSLPTTVEGTEALELSSIDPRDVTLEVESRAHPGVVRLVPRTDVDHGAMDVINHVPLEAYLPGVVGKELYPDWELEAFMAQAVAARSFAASEHAYFSGRRHFDLTNTAHSQVYGGAEEHWRSIDAVIMTRGEMLEYRTRLVPGYYSSCCGGVSASAVDAIGSNPINDIRPLHGRGREEACRDAPVFAWQVERSTREVTLRLASFGRRNRRTTLAGFRRVEAIEVAESNPHGRPRTFRVADRSGAEATLSADELRRAVNSSVAGLSPPRHRLKSSNVTAEIDASRIVFHGRGFGHGVGLCQYGAQNHARDGMPYGEIIEWYYPGALVRRAYG